MKERQILFSAPMVRALLDGSKTQTRRAVKPRHLARIDLSRGGCIANWSKPMPYGQPGDRLWVREHWATDSIHDTIPPREVPPAYATRYLADGAERGGLGQPDGKDRRAFHMPRWASRITLEITGVRVERLQDISEADAMAEGCRQPACGPGYTLYKRWAYRNLWQSINGPGSWDANPWVWVVEFKRMEGSAA